MSCAVKRVFEPELMSPLQGKRCKLMAPPELNYVAPLSPWAMNAPSDFQRRASESPLQLKENASAFNHDAGSPVGKRKRGLFDREASGSSPRAEAAAPEPQSPVPLPNHSHTCASCGSSLQREEECISAEQVKEAIELAVRQKEVQLSQEYDKILHDKLTEQFHVFSKFNQDHIHRQMDEQPCSYMT
eukprot:m.16629 g.16629  ORF g.16629 m.16629 type:complete len:187 (-) comp3159_c0_seq1:246-806(-)